MLLIKLFNNSDCLGLMQLFFSKAQAATDDFYEFFCSVPFLFSVPDDMGGPR